MSRTVSPVLLMAPLITSHLPVRPRSAARRRAISSVFFTPPIPAGGPLRKPSEKGPGQEHAARRDRTSASVRTSAGRLPFVAAI